MTASCTDLDAYLDESLASADREPFEHHLLGCARCQRAVEDFMQLLAAGAELAERADRPHVRPHAVPAGVPEAVIPIDRARSARPRRRIGSWWIAAAGTAASLAAALLLWLSSRPTLEDHISAALAPHRPFVERLPYGPLDRYRSYDTVLGDRELEHISLTLTAEVEQHRTSAALVAILLANGDLDHARQHLAELARSGIAHAAGSDRDEALKIDQAVLALHRRQYPEALRYLDEVLARSPRNGVALWDRALVLRELQLPLAAADAFEDVARLGELGWSGEAWQRVAELRGAEAVRAQRWRAAFTACKEMSAAHLPDRAVVRANTSVCRPTFYKVVRGAVSRDEVEALLPIAEVLDEEAGNTAATRLVREVAAADPAQRRRALASLQQLTRATDQSSADKRRLLDEIRATNQTDLLLAAVNRAGLPGWRDEYAARAAATMDPFFLQIGEQRSAELLLEGGDPLGAEVVLRRTVDECTKHKTELHCSYLRQRLADVYEAMNRPSDERDVAQQGLDRSRQLGLYWDEPFFLLYLAEAARADGAHALMRAYLHESTLRSGSVCEQVRYADDTLAVASIDELDFARARRELMRSPVCGAAPTPSRTRVIAELARRDGTASEAAALRAELVHARQLPDQTPGQLAYLEALEGRLLAARDPGAARPLLQHAIEVADRLGRIDMDGVKARADAYASLLVLAASGADRAATLALFARAAGAPLREGCTVGVMVDAERVLVVTRDRTGKLEQAFDPDGRHKPALDAAALVPAALVRALDGCERIDVLALPPVFGLPNLLPPTLAWSYRDRSAALESPPSRSPHVVTVTGVVPPGELGLAPLQAMTLAPIPGASHRELRGAEATPAGALGAFAGADVVEIHAHGVIDLKRSDSSLIVLSPEADGHFALNAREIAALKLPRAPLVILAACHAAYTAPYRHEPWGLPHAFLLAGARAVLASPETISDAEAGGFFRAVEQRILDGIDPAIALRDERRRQLARDPSSWTHDVLLFD
jgi:cellulose synthase operon protein C